MAAAVNARAQQIEDGVRARGYEVMVERTALTGSGIVSFRHPSLGSHAVVSELKRHRISAAPRQGWVRMAPHFYISPEDIEATLEVLPAI
jgi:selenocysteine lyase/cysteine desulfurase